jgi:hypothetical protein
MSATAWSFSGEPYLSRTEFEVALKGYQLDIMKNPSWDPSELILLSPQVIAKLDEWDDGDEDEEENAGVTLTADDRKAFSAGELMFKVHNAYVGQLRDRDHHFFEGFVFFGLREGVPVYQINLGS